MSEYTAYLLPAARDRILEHVLFLAQISVSAAERLYGKLRMEIDSLSYDPARYPVYSPRKCVCADAELRYNFCARRHRIVFEVIDEAAFIYDVQDCRQHHIKSLV